MSTGSQTTPSQLGTSGDLRPLGARRLRGHLEGTADHRPPLVLLHGLTFDRRMWQPAISALQRRDPGRLVLALDLPGHGGSPMQASCDLDEVAAAVASAVDDAGLDAPVVVGHSISGIIASLYATSFPTRGVVNVDQTLDTAFIQMLQANRDAVVGPAFAAVWQGLLASMHLDLLPDSARQLLSTELPQQDVVLAYWRQALELPEAEVRQLIAQTSGTLRRALLPYTIIAGHECDDAYAAWLHGALPQATVTVYPNSGHFPHLADPDRFAECLAATGQWSLKHRES